MYYCDGKAVFSASLIQSLVSHDHSSEIFLQEETFLLLIIIIIINNIETVVIFNLFVETEFFSRFDE